MPGDPPENFFDLEDWLSENYGRQVFARIEDRSGAIMCPVCDLEMAIVETKAGIIVAFACDSGGRGHWLGAWHAGGEWPT